MMASCEWCTHATDLSRLQRTVRVVGVPLKADFELLRSAAYADAGESYDLRSFTVDDGARLTCFLNLADLPLPARTASPYHALRSIGALWLRAAEAQPLKTGQTLDRLTRQAALSARRRAGIAVYVAGEGLDPAVRSLLTSRFGPPGTGGAVPWLLAGGSPARREAA
jgi:hypothetical protein